MTKTTALAALASGFGFAILRDIVPSTGPWITGFAILSVCCFLGYALVHRARRVAETTTPADDAKDYDTLTDYSAFVNPKVPEMLPDGRPRLIDGDDRSAGRWCGECRQYGSHHTERHEDFLYPGI